MLIAPKNMRTTVQAKANIFQGQYNRKPTFVCGKSNFPILSVCRSLGRDTKEPFYSPFVMSVFFSYLFWHFYSLSSIWKPATEREWSWIVGPSFASYLHADGHPHFFPHASPWPQIRPTLVPRRLLRGRLEQLRRTKWWTRTKNLLLHFLYVHAVCYSLR